MSENETLTTTPPESPPLKFENPYPRESFERVQLWIGRDDVMFIRLLRPQIGTFSAVGGHLWQKLCDALRLRGINDFTQSTEFEQFTQNSTIISNAEYESLKHDSTMWQQHIAGRILPEPRGPLDGPIADTNEGNVRKGPKRLRAVHPDKPAKRSDVQRDGSEKGE